MYKGVVELHLYIYVPFIISNPMSRNLSVYVMKKSKLYKLMYMQVYTHGRAATNISFVWISVRYLILVFKWHLDIRLMFANMQKLNMWNYNCNKMAAEKFLAPCYQLSTPVEYWIDSLKNTSIVHVVGYSKMVWYFTRNELWQ